MRKIIALLMIALLLVSLPACGLIPGGNSGFTQNDSSDNDADDNDNDNDNDNDDGDNDDDDGDSGGSISFSGSWPSKLDSVPEFTYGNIINVTSATESGDGIDFDDYIITFEKADKDAAEKYAAELEKAGFELAFEPYEMEDAMTGNSYVMYEYEKFAFETDDTLYNISVDFWVTTDDVGSVYIAVPNNSGSGGSQSQDSGSQQDDDGGGDDNGGSEYNWDTLSEDSIPDGYPHDDVPLIGIEKGSILGSSRQDMGGEGTAFIIVFGIDEDVETVCDMIGSQLEQHVTGNGGTFQAIMSQMLMGEINNCQYTVAIGDGSSDGYKTVVDYTVIVS